MKEKIYFFKDEDELIFTGKQIREFKSKIIEETSKEKDEEFLNEMTKCIDMEDYINLEKKIYKRIKQRRNSQ